MARIFLVVLAVGDYDRAYYNLRAFLEQEEAEQFAESERKRLLIRMGLDRAHRAIMREWDQKNPLPTAIDGALTSVPNENESLSAFLEVAYRKWEAARSAEAERLDKVLDLDPVNPPGYLDEDFRISVQEVPFGAPEN